MPILWVQVSMRRWPRRNRDGACVALFLATAFRIYALDRPCRAYSPSCVPESSRSMVRVFAEAHLKPVYLGHEFESLPLSLTEVCVGITLGRQPVRAAAW